MIDGHSQDVIPYDVMEGTTRHLMSLIEYIKVQRNDAVHPMTFQVSADSVRFSLNAFPLTFKKVEALRSRHYDSGASAIRVRSELLRFNMLQVIHLGGNLGHHQSPTATRFRTSGRTQQNSAGYSSLEWN
jgi:hypothetical protein